MINIYAPSTLRSDARLAAWHHKPGDFFKEFETLADIDQSDAVYEVSIPENGILVEILVKVDSSVTANQIIATYRTDNLRSRLAAVLAKINSYLIR
jgi:pyruvate/2-oxoglutarate dehydrogenase complex dihydrolipoamide acyltransferase (E2) component